VLKAAPAPKLVEVAPARKLVKAVKATSLAALAVPVPSVSKDVPMTTETPAKTFEAIAPSMEKATAEMTAKVKDMMEKNMKSMTEMTEFAKGNVEAMVESAKAAAAGAETLTAHFVETSKKSMEEAQAAFKTMTTAKTPNELMAAQNDFAKAQFDKAVANMSHFSETWMKLAGDVVQPISSRMAVAAETVKKSIAA
jgi:phasin family protein